MSLGTSFGRNGLGLRVDGDSRGDDESLMEHGWMEHG